MYADTTHLERVLRDNRIDPDRLRNALVLAMDKYREIQDLLPTDHASLADEFGRYADEVEGWINTLDGED